MASLLAGPQLYFPPTANHVAPRRSPAIRVLLLWHLASLDAPTVAIVWAFAIAHSAHVHLELWIAFLLAAGTWTVYVLDRLLDTRRASNCGDLSLLRERHRFHWQHRRTLIPLAACGAATAIAIICKLMPARAREHDSILAAAALVYFSGVHAPAQLPPWLRRLCSKEMLVGILFAVGCAAPTFTRAPSLTWPALLSTTFFTLLAWLNCAAISTWESQVRCSSVAVPASLLAFSGLTCAALLAPQFTAASTLLLSAAVSATLLLVIDGSRRSLAPVLVRSLADLTLLAPAVLLLPTNMPGAMPR